MGLASVGSAGAGSGWTQGNVLLLLLTLSAGLGVPYVFPNYEDPDDFAPGECVWAITAQGTNKVADGRSYFEIDTVVAYKTTVLLDYDHVGGIYSTGSAPLTPQQATTVDSNTQIKVIARWGDATSDDNFARCLSVPVGGFTGGLSFQTVTDLFKGSAWNVR